MDADTPEEDRDVRMNKRGIDNSTETTYKAIKMATPPKKKTHISKVISQPTPKYTILSSNPSYNVPKPVSKTFTVPSNLNDKIKARSKLNTETSNKIKKSYLDASVRIERQEIPEGSKARVKFQFTPGYGANDPREVLENIFDHLKVIDPKAQVLPWDVEDKNHSGPIKMADLASDSPISKPDLKFYVDFPQNTTREGYSQGQKIWNVRVHLNTTIKEDKLKAVWSSKKRDIINSGLAFTSITMSCIQDSPKAFLIGTIAQGSTKGMNEQLINSRLENVVGIPGIRVSYQTIHQPGITKQLWDNAYRKARATTTSPTSRDFLDKKYAWVPEGLGVYVTNSGIADMARKKMMAMYGTTNEHGVPPVWPGGEECMRFVPLKESYINSDRTRAKVDRRFKLHVYLKANERL